MSLYAEYLKERTDDGIIESEYGFATYRWMADGKSVYIVDIYTVPEYREKGIAAAFADEICKLAKEKGCTCVIGTVVPSAKGSTLGLKALIGYGMCLQSSGADMIVMRKEI